MVPAVPPEDTGPAPGSGHPDAAGPNCLLDQVHHRIRYWSLAEEKPNPGRSIVGTSYCDVAPGHEWHGPYHDREYGFPLRGDAELFERLVLEINQAGLSWLTILKKRDAFRRAYGGFDPAVVAALRRARPAAAAGRRRHHPQPAQGGRRHRQRGRDPGAGASARLVRRLARRAPPAQQGRVGQALQARPSGSPAARSWASS